ncbi:MAG: hypothetical protein ABIN58_09420, partial [candidate division WOR-3 bacterium]
PVAVRDALRVTATPFPQYGPSKDCSTATCGAGIVRADWALLAAQGVDFVPDSFSIPPRNDVPLATTVTSESIVIRGLGHATPISVQYGEYSLGCTQSFTRNPGEVSDGQSEKDANNWNMGEKKGKEYGLKMGVKVSAFSKQDNDKAAKAVWPLLDEYVANAKKAGLPGDEALKFCLDELKKIQQ